MPAATEGTSDARARVRVSAPGTGLANVTSGLPVLDHLLAMMARYAGLDLELEVAVDTPPGQIAGVGRALGAELARALAAPGVRGYGSAALPADEALAHVALEFTGRPRVVSNVDLTSAHVAGLATDLVARFLGELADGGGLTLHVRLIEGEDTQHVLDAIFKALGVALGQACTRKER